MEAKKTLFNRFLMWAGERLITAAIYRRWPKEIAGWKQMKVGGQSFPENKNKILAGKFIKQKKQEGFTFVTAEMLAKSSNLNFIEAHNALWELFKTEEGGLVRRLMTTCTNMECSEPVDITPLLGSVPYTVFTYQCEFCQTTSEYRLDDGYIEYVIVSG